MTSNDVDNPAIAAGAQIISRLPADVQRQLMDLLDNNAA